VDVENTWWLLAVCDSYYVGKQYLPASMLCTMLRELRTNSGSSLGFIVEMWDDQAR